MTFEKILYVKKIGGGRGPAWTEFGFVSAGRSYEKVFVPGRPNIAAGLSVIALLRKEDDWHTLAGWINKESGDIAVDNATYYVFMAAACAMAFCFNARQAAIAATTGGTGLAFYFEITLSLFMAIVTAVSLRRYLTIRSVARQLKRVRTV